MMFQGLFITPTVETSCFGSIVLYDAGTEDWTEGLPLTNQELYHLNHTTNLFHFLYFGIEIGSSNFFQTGLK
jgi:hypothetical protein